MNGNGNNFDERTNERTLFLVHGMSGRNLDAHGKQNRRVLVVDDESEVIGTYQDILCGNDQLSEELNDLLETFNIQTEEESYPTFALHVANSGDEAIELVQEALQQRQPYAVIFMDVRMPPGMDGVEAAEKIRAMDNDVYIVFVSAYSDYSAYEMQCKLNRNMLLLSKPFEEEMLHQMAHTLCMVWEREHQLSRTNKRLQAHSKIMEHQATHDSLTRVYNRHYLDTVLEIEFNRAQREWLPIGLLMIDIDWFKRYNDHYGHLLGDQTLTRVAQSIAQEVKRPADFVARYGGEEFSVVLPNTDPAGVEVIAERLRDAVESLKIEFPEAEDTDWITVSIGGISYLPGKSEGVESFADLMESADRQLYLAKEEGKNCCRIMS